MRFDRLGCFAYSMEEGTAAARLPEQLDEETKQRRADIIMQEQLLLLDGMTDKDIGRTIEVVAEGYDRYAGCYYGRSSSEAPDIDGKIFFSSESPVAVGEYITVKITEAIDYDLFGEAVQGGNRDESSE